MTSTSPTSTEYPLDEATMDELHSALQVIWREEVRRGTASFSAAEDRFRALAVEVGLPAEDTDREVESLRRRYDEAVSLGDIV
jgi:hypothetical protein